MVEAIKLKKVAFWVYIAQGGPKVPRGKKDRSVCVPVGNKRDVDEVRWTLWQTVRQRRRCKRGLAQAVLSRGRRTADLD